MVSAARRLGPLTALGAGSILIDALAFARLYPLVVWWNYARLDYAWLTRYELSGQLLFLGAFAMLFALYAAAFQLLRHEPNRGPLWLILLIQGGLGLTLAGIYPVAALDLFDYLLYGRLAVYWGANPLAEPPARYPGEPLVAYSYWPNEPSVYGPFWQIVSEQLTLLVQGQLYAGLYAFKLLAVVAALLTSVAIWATLRRTRPQLASAGALLYGWNPLQQFETAGNGHNDALMVLFLALAILLLSERRRVLALPAFVAGLLVKMTLAPLTPLFLLAPLLGEGDWRGRLRDLAAGALLAAALTGGLYAPYWEGRASLPFLDRGGWFTASPATLVRELFRTWYDLEQAGKVAALLCGMLFAVVALLLLVRFVARQLRQPPATLVPAVIEAGYQLFFAYLVIACLWWQPWYLLVLLALAALSGEAARAVRANLFCLGGLLSYPVFKYIWAVHQGDWHLDYFRIMAISVVAIFTLPLLHLGLELLRRLHGLPLARSAPLRAPGR